MTNKTIYEKNYRLGGRLHTVNVDRDHYEAGGSIIHERNQYVAHFMAKFGMGCGDKKTLQL